MKNGVGFPLVWLVGAVLVLLGLELQAGEHPFNQDNAQHDEILDTTEVTAASIDLSPDGKSIAFDLLGHIFTVPSGGGDAKQVTYGTAWNSRPVWSPDGRNIAFISDASGVEQAHVIPASGASADRQITSISSAKEWQDQAQMLGYVEWLPDGKKIIVDGGMVSVEELGQAAHLFSRESSVRVHSSGVLVAVGEYSNDARFPTNGLWISDISSGNNELLVRTDDEMYLADALMSPDGVWVIYNERHVAKGQEGFDGALRVKNTRTGETRELVSAEEMLGWQPKPGWKNARVAVKRRMDISPDSQFLYLNFKGKLWRVSLESGERIALEFDAHVRRPYSRPILHPIGIDSDGQVTIRSARNLSRSPSGHNVVFSAARTIFHKDLRTGSIGKLFDQPGLGQYQPAYSPDGTRIAYVTWDDAAKGQLWVVPAHGGTARAVMSAPGFYRNPMWTPDGRSILLFSANEKKDFGGYRRRRPSAIVMVDVASSTVRPVVDSAALDIGLSISSDGSMVYYTPFQNDRVSRYIASVDLKSGKSQPITHDNFLPNEPSFTSVSVSPDGKAVAIVKYGDLYLEEVASTPSDTRRSLRLTYAGGGEPVWVDNGASLAWTFAGRICEKRISGREFSMVESQDSQGAVDTPEVRCENIDLRLPRKRHHGTIALRNAKIISMRGDEIIEEGIVLVEDDRISAVGSSNDISIPSDAAVYDLGGRVVIPGLIDMHGHANTASVFLDAAPIELQAYLAYGITTVRDPSSGGDYAFAYGEMIDAGVIEGPRLFNTVGLLANMHRINDEQDAVDLVARLKSMGATMVKMHTGWNRNQRRWIIASARNQGLNVVVHQADPWVFKARADLSQVADGVTSVEHELVLESLPYRDVMGFVERVGTWHTPTHLSTVGGYHRKYWMCMQADPRFARYPPSREPKGTTSIEACNRMDLVDLDEPAASQSRLSAKSALSGSGVLIGSHGDYDGYGFHWELWAQARGGLTAHQALRLATIGNARGLGMDREIGSIEVGKIADMVVLDGDPLADIKNTLKAVNIIKNGIIYDPQTLKEIGGSVH